MIAEFVATGQARYVFKHMPVLGENAVFAAVAVECAAEQGAFWPLHDRFMADDTTLFTEAGLRRQVTFEGLNYEEFTQCLEAGSTLPRVQASYEEGISRGVRSTPTIFVKDEQVEATYEAVAEAVRRALAEAAE